MYDPLGAGWVPQRETQKKTQGSELGLGRGGGERAGLSPPLPHHCRHLHSEAAARLPWLAVSSRDAEIWPQVTAPCWFTLKYLPVLRDCSNITGISAPTGRQGPLELVKLVVGWEALAPGAVIQEGGEYQASGLGPYPLDRHPWNGSGLSPGITEPNYALGQSWASRDSPSRRPKQATQPQCGLGTAAGASPRAAFTPRKSELGPSDWGQLALPLPTRRCPRAVQGFPRAGLK